MRLSWAGLAVASASFLSACGLSACGYMGQPLPPALKRPLRVTDLAAVERGPKIVIQFTVPKVTTEDIPLRGNQDITLFIGLQEKPFDYAKWQQTATRVPISARDDDGRPKAIAMVNVPAMPWYGKSVYIAVDSRGPSGHWSGPSNFVPLRVATELPTPENIQAKDAPDAVELHWNAKAREFRIFRKLVSDPEWRQIGMSDMPSYVDKTIGYGQTYQYMVQSVEKVDDTYAESDLSDVTTFRPVDTFPPAVPVGLSAIAGSRSIELVWERNAEKDFGSYRVYRDGKRITEDLTAPSYSDRDVKPGVKYSYQVSAVDTAGNESARTPAVDAVLP